MFQLDFTSTLAGLQAALTQTVNAGIALMLKLGLLWFACLVVGAFLPRWLRPLVPLAALALVLAYGDAAVGALARAGLVPRVNLDLASAAAPAGSGGLASQVEEAVNSYVNWIAAQLGI